MRCAKRTACTVLYVEDDLTNLRLVEAVLRKRPGVRLLPALGGLAGLTLAGRYLPDLILLDVHLPDLHGGEVVRRLRADSATRSIPVVVVSADTSAETVERMNGAGVAGFLTKPLDLERLLAVADSQLAGP